MPPNAFWRAVLIAIVSVVAIAPARAETLGTAEAQIITGIVVVSAGIGVAVTVLILHHKHKDVAITGCVVSGAGGMSMTDEKDQQRYALSGDPVGVKAGNRMTLEGKRKHTGGTLIFEARAVTKDFGACAP